MVISKATLLHYYNQQVVNFVACTSHCHPGQVECHGTENTHRRRKYHCTPNN